MITEPSDGELCQAVGDRAIYERATGAVGLSHKALTTTWAYKWFARYANKEIDIDKLRERLKSLGL